MFSNAKLLLNICDGRRNLALYCNAGKAIITKKGDLKGYGTVWFNLLTVHTTGAKKCIQHRRKGHAKNQQYMKKKSLKKLTQQTHNMTQK